MEDKRKVVPAKRKKGNHKKARTAMGIVSKVLKTLGTVLLSVFLIVIITSCIFATVLTIYVLNFADTTSTVSLEQVAESNITRFVYENPEYNPDDPASQQYKLYYALRNESRHVIWADIENIPQYTQDAFVYSEDERFYSHDGIDFKRTIGAFVNIFLPLYPNRQGGSTITQQTIKNVTGDNEAAGIKGIERKIREIFRTINVEKVNRKEDILQCYLNVVPLGTTKYDIVGVQAAANFYFGKDVKDLTLAESAALAGMTNAPAANNPVDGVEGNNKIRRDRCLNKMLENGAISEDEFNQAMNEKLKVVGNFNYSSATVYDDETKDQGPTSYFMDEALTEAENRIAKYYGISVDEASQRLFNGGYTVYTTVDYNMQKKIEANMQNPKNFTGYALENDTLLSAFIAMDYTGCVKAVVGSRKPKTEMRTFNTATQGMRSPGSCIKPIASYAPAVEQDIINWSTLIKDEPITVKNAQGVDEKWPVNYSDYGSSGNWSYQNMYTWQMLAQSKNTAPAQLVKKLTPEYCYNFLKEKLDITTLDEKDAKLYSGVTVGGFTNGLHLSELVGGYMIFGNGGRKYEVSYISSIEDASGKAIYEKSDGFKQAISESSAYVMNRIMQNVVNDPTGTGRNAKLVTTDLVAKTGTSSNWEDLSLVGCTPDYVSGIWIGYDNHKTIPTGSYYNSDVLWKNIFGEIAENEPDKKFTMPDSVVKAKYCRSTGLLASKTCGNTAEGYYKKSSLPKYCNH